MILYKNNYFWQSLKTFSLHRVVLAFHQICGLIWRDRWQSKWRKEMQWRQSSMEHLAWEAKPWICLPTYALNTFFFRMSMPGTPTDDTTTNSWPMTRKSPVSNGVENTLKLWPITRAVKIVSIRRTKMTFFFFDISCGRTFNLSTSQVLFWPFVPDNVF